MSESPSSHARSRARRLAVQALYQCLVGNDTAEEVVRQFLDERNTGRADLDYLREVVMAAMAQRGVLEASIDPLLDRPLVQLDPVEHAILLLGMHELTARPDVPWRVVLDEAVELARLFGGEQGYKFINAVLDRAARQLRDE